MPVPIQFGGVVDRLRSFLRLTGRAPLQLDDTVVPVVITGDVGRVPYAVEPVHFSVNMVQNAVAAQMGCGAVGLPATATGCAVIDECISSLDPVAAASYRQLVLDHIANLTAVGLTVTSQVPRVNLLNPQTLLANVLQSSACVFLTGSRATPLLGTAVASWIANPGTVFTIRGPWVLPPGGALGFWQVAVNVRVDVTFRGRYFPDVQEAIGA